VPSIFCSRLISNQVQQKAVSLKEKTNGRLYLSWTDDEKEVESKTYIHLNLLKKKIIDWCSVHEITLGLLNTTRELNFTSTGRHVLFVISYFRFSCDVVIFINKKLPILLSF